MGMQQDETGHDGEEGTVDVNEIQAHAEQVTHDEETLRRALASLVSAGLTEGGATEAINQMLNDNLVIRDRTTRAGIFLATSPRCKIPTITVAGAWFQCWCGARWHCVEVAETGKVVWQRHRPHSNEVTITVTQLAKFVRAYLELGALEAAGVDNWDGYGEVDWDQLDKDVDRRVARLMT